MPEQAQTVVKIQTLASENFVGDVVYVARCGQFEKGGHNELFRSTSAPHVCRDLGQQSLQPKHQFASSGATGAAGAADGAGQTIRPKSGVVADVVAEDCALGAAKGVDCGAIALGGAVGFIGIGAPIVAPANCSASAELLAIGTGAASVVGVGATIGAAVFSGRRCADRASGKGAGCGASHPASPRTQQRHQSGHAPPQRARRRGFSDRTIAGNYGSIGAAIKPQTQIALFFGDELLRLGARHLRKVVDVFVTTDAKAGALVAGHAVPVGAARLGDLQFFERNEVGVHGCALTAPGARFCSRIFCGNFGALFRSNFPMKFSWPALLLASVFAVSVAQAAPVPAGRADDFVDAIGVATHWGYLDTPYGDFERAAPLLAQLGVRHVRDSLHPRERELWEKYGIRTTALLGPGDVNAQLQQIKQNRDWIEMIEGPNEVDIFPQSAQYRGTGFPDGPRKYQNELYAALKSDPATASLPVIAPSTARATSNQQLKPLDAYDYLVMHSYAGGQKPSDSLESDVNNNIQIARGLQSAGETAKRIVVTESGYHTATQADQTLGGVQPGISQATGAKYFPRHFALYWNAGIKRTFTYEFLNEFPDEATNAEASFGLVRRDFTPKPAYVAVKNLIALLSEARWNPRTQSWDKPQFAPRALDFELTGDTRDVRSTLLQKADGTFYLLLWREVSSYNTQTQTPIENTEALVTINLSDRADIYARRVRDNALVTPLANPLNPAIRDEPVPGTTFGRLKYAQTFGVPDEVIALQITPALAPTDRTAPAPPTGLSATTTGTAVALKWRASPDKDVAGYFVSRLGQQIGRVERPNFADEKLAPATGYPYESARLRSGGQPFSARANYGDDQKRVSRFGGGQSRFSRGRKRHRPKRALRGDAGKSRQRAHARRCDARRGVLGGRRICGVVGRVQRAAFARPGGRGQIEQRAKRHRDLESGGGARTSCARWPTM